MTLNFLWLEITGKCQQSCIRCYSDSGPRGSHGQMAVSDWQQVLADFARLPAVNAARQAITGPDQRMVQFIGGEPTLHPGLPELIRYALSHGLLVEVFSNLVAIRRQVWDALRLPGVRLATSYHSANAQMHDAVTRVAGSHAHTERNIAKARQLGIPLRVGAVDIAAGRQRLAVAERLQQLGVVAGATKHDQTRRIGRVRQTGQAAADVSVNAVTELCSQCTRNRAAILPDGNVYPCVMARFMEPAGNVLRQPLAAVVNGEPFRMALSELDTAFASRTVCSNDLDCNPQPCAPDSCDPWNCVPGAECMPTR